MGICRDKDIWASITRRMELGERGIHAGLVGDAKAKGAAMEGRAASGGEEEEKVVARIYHNMLLSGKLMQAGRQATNREGGDILPPNCHG